MLYSALILGGINGLREREIEREREGGERERERERERESSKSARLPWESLDVTGRSAQSIFPVVNITDKMPQLHTIV